MKSFQINTFGNKILKKKNINLIYNTFLCSYTDIIIFFVTNKYNKNYKY